MTLQHYKISYVINGNNIYVPKITYQCSIDLFSFFKRGIDQWMKQEKYENFCLE